MRGPGTGGTSRASNGRLRGTSRLVSGMVGTGDTLVVVGEDCAFYPDLVVFCDPRDFGPERRGGQATFAHHHFYSALPTRPREHRQTSRSLP